MALTATPFVRHPQLVPVGGEQVDLALHIGAQIEEMLQERWSRFGTSTGTPLVPL